MPFLSFWTRTASDLRQCERPQVSGWSGSTVDRQKPRSTVPGVTLPLSLSRLVGSMPTRRIFEVMLVVAILARPAFGLIHLWAAKTLGTQPEDSIAHGAAEIVAVLV